MRPFAPVQLDLGAMVIDAHNVVYRSLYGLTLDVKLLTAVNYGQGSWW